MVPGKQFNKDLMLAWFLHHLASADRAKLMAELPVAYNDVLRCDAVTVVRNCDQSPMLLQDGRRSEPKPGLDESRPLPIARTG